MVNTAELQNSNSPNQGAIPRVLLVGYNGANNTGSEARLLSIIKDIQNLLGSHVQITVPTLNEENLRRYLDEDEYLHIAPIPSIFFFAIDKLVKEHDLVLLVEGSCYMDTWTSALLWAFLWATRSAHQHGVPCLAYAVDAGELSSLNRWLVKREASKTNLIITRTKHAQRRLEKIGVTAPLISTADCAFTFSPEPEDRDFLNKIWPETVEGVVGLAVVDFSLWPVVIRPWGRKENLYKWPYYFSSSRERMNTRESLVKGWASIADQIVEKHSQNVALICMEALDQSLARDILQELKNKGSCRVISSNDYNASQMTSMLSQLDLLVTSRYHSAVLSLRNCVPQIAVGHDPRLTSLYHDLHLYQDYFLRHDAPNLWEDLSSKIDLLLDSDNLQEDILKQGLKGQMNLSQMNREILGEFLKQKISMRI
ncbi:MAG: polysaccharide pyruvyl transferase family protein [Methanobacterium sp.]|nr:polysaccharide pyruvyl transferase family protein [Methanobacterium sp.]